MRKLKGFTLLELIIVMAILTILMAAIMQMFKPIRETYVDATLYESQRAAQNGIITYIGESVRYSTDLAIYPKDKLSKQSITGAVEEFTKAYLNANGVYAAGNSEGKPVDPDYNTKYNKTLEKMKRTAEIIIIDNEEKGADEKYKYTFLGDHYYGRLLRRKFIPNDSYDAVTDPAYKMYDELTDNAEDHTKSECRIALGAAYYGDRNYTIKLEEGIGNITDQTHKTSKKAVSDGKWLANEGIKITVSSINGKSSRLTENTADSNGEGLVKVSGEVACKNQCSPVNGMFDSSKLSSPSTGKPVAVPTGVGTKIYIVYINDKVEIEK